MPFPIRECVICSKKFELKPDKPGFANRCPECSEAEADDRAAAAGRIEADDRKSASEVNEARRNAMRDLLYRKES